MIDDENGGDWELGLSRASTREDLEHATFATLTDPDRRRMVGCAASADALPAPPQ